MPREVTKLSCVFPGAAIRTGKDRKEPRNEICFHAKSTALQCFLSKFTFLGVVLIVGVICLHFQLPR